MPEYDIRIYKRIERVYGVLFAPPCTVWANSGVRWWNQRTPDEIFEAMEILMAGIRIIRDTFPVFWVIENPVGKLRKLLGEPRLIFNPCDYGDPYTKKTLLWGEFNIPEKKSVKPIEGSKIHLIPPSEDRGVLRSITPPGFAKAFFRANR